MTAAPAAEAAATLHRCIRSHHPNLGIDAIGSTSLPRRPLWLPRTLQLSRCGDFDDELGSCGV